ncbi:hypothetical protein DR64_8220 [Paraburkholderia xenovorans LB400]|uniref:Uncharacterized protein n=1 Tax=Paraburkholderia xenovorans (strain LB400) TaxID=266265 RepID=Q13IF4_PARXL|nr:hypothetical protein [Paraburkholderia xenovorans]ABE36135.1 hypothetical protein Bxe_C0211 [Paraburkholderia xenovorans LB400]AIP34854.1 hypothetical protein DR64_8220 [Paraburkholderia xenovorans LB400]
MEQELEVLRGQIHGLVAAVSTIASVLPDSASADAAEVLGEMIATTGSSGLSATALDAMHATMRQVSGALAVSLHR